MNDGILAAERGPHRRSRFAKFQARLGILLSLVCLAWLIGTTDWAGAWSALAQVDYSLVVVATLLNLASVLLRSARWRLMFRTRCVPPFGRLTAALIVGQAVNVLAPARLGDLARAVLVGTGGTVYTLGTLMVEVALDLLMLVVLVVLLLSQATLPAWWRGSGYVLVVTAALEAVAQTLSCGETGIE